MFGLSFGHLVIVLVVLLLFGARRLPELGGALGKGLRAFKKGIEGGGEENDKIDHNKDGKGPGNTA
ncbi:twin-arginine translocase TatA/TatE family subunit [bacterium]|jgi:sec-independent protein translocase protein TatA|nr:twin-arginine translocase TatA/TatE family subunit [bacterium]